MEISVVSQEGLFYNIKVVVPNVDVLAKVNEELKKIQKDAKVDGFRPGKVPLSVLQNLYGSGALRDTVEYFVDKGVDEGLKKYDIKPILRPKVSVGQIAGKNSDVELTFEVENTPKVPEINFADIEITDFKVDPLTDEETNKITEETLKDNPAFKIITNEKDLKSENAIYLHMMVYNQDQKLVEGLSYKQHQDTDEIVVDDCLLVSSAHDIYPDLATKILESGIKVGEKFQDDKFVFTDKKLTMTGGYEDNQEFKVEITPMAVAEKHTALDDEYIKLKKFEYKTAEEYLKELKEDYLKEGSREGEQVSRIELFDYLDEKTDVEYPMKMVGQEEEQIKKQNDLQENKLSEDAIQKLAKRRVKLALIIGKYAQDKNVQVDEQQLGQYIAYRAMISGVSMQKYVEYLRSNPEELNNIKVPLLEEEAVKQIIAECKKRKSKKFLTPTQKSLKN